MKQILLVAFTITIFSCGNQKQEIVEQIKVYKDSLTTIEKRRAVLNDRVMEVQSKYIGQQSLDSVAVVDREQSAERAELKVKRWVFQGKIDSLELELKKY